MVLLQFPSQKVPRMPQSRKQAQQRSSKGSSSTDSLSELCTKVLACDIDFDSVRDKIETLSHQECEESGIDGTLQSLNALALSYESMIEKNEEVIRDLAEIYILIGDLHQEHGSIEDSVAWYQKAIVVDDGCCAAYQGLATSLVKLGEIHRAIRCLEQEIQLAPGNLSSYLVLSDLYDSVGESIKMEQMLEELLRHNPQSVQALHRLIRHHSENNPEVNVSFLRRRLTSIVPATGAVELGIWAHHMCMELRSSEALKAVIKRHKEHPDPFLSLLVAHLLWVAGKHDEMMNELRVFCERNSPGGNAARRAFREFTQIFGEVRAEALRQATGASYSQRMCS